LEYYDIVSETCDPSDNLAERLGFRKIFSINKDIPAMGAGFKQGKETGEGIAFGRDVTQLITFVKNGVKAVSITGSFIDEKLMEAIAANGTILCLPMSQITASHGQERSKNVFRMRRLFKKAMKMKIPISFASMAKTPKFMNSYMQLIELAKLIGADDKYARYSLGEINRRIGKRQQ
jgi:hypothetical protein